MANIVVYRDPAGVAPAEVHNLSGEISLAQWILDNLSENTEGLHCQILLNGREIVNSASMPIEQCCSGAAIQIGAFDNVTIRFRPQGVDPYTLAYIAIAAIAAAAISIALAPKPRVPGRVDDDSSGRTSNNQLNSSTNSFRPRQAIPDIAGEIISYPDFAQPSYYEYDAAGRRVFTEYFIVGVGQYLQNGDVKEGDTPFPTLKNYESELLPPGTHPTTLLNARRNESTVDVDLLSADQQTVTIYPAPETSTVDLVGTIITLINSDYLDLQASVADVLTVNVECASNEPGNPNFSIDGTYTVVSINTVGPYTDIELSGPPFTDAGSIISGYISNENFVFDSPWYVLPGTSIEEVWLHFKMPSGIRKGDGTEAVVGGTIEVELLDSNEDPTGTVYSSGFEFFGNTQSPQYQTKKITAEDGLSPGRYRARATRITSYLGDNSLDLLTLDGIDAMTSYTPNWGDVTALYVKRTSSQRVNRVYCRKVNVSVTRKLRIYDNSTGIYGATYEPTRRFCDYVFYLLHEKAGVPIAQINTDELFGIQNSLSDAELGYFDYTFSDGNIALRERIETACNVARVRYWNEGLLWSFVREESKPFKSLMFNRRNLLPTASSYAQKFRRPADYDSVTVIYVDPDKNAEKRVSKKIDGFGAIVDGIGIRPLEIRLSGCRNDLQALNRCNLEIRRLIYQSIKVGDTALTDAQLARIGMRVDWVDMYDSDLFDGELLSVAGNVYTTSERFEPEVGVEYWVYVTDDSGTPSNSVRAYPRADGNKFGFEATGLTGAYLAGGAIQSGSRYFIASNSDADASTFTVIGRGRPNERGECTIELAEYNELMFEADEITSYVEPGYVEPGYVR